MNILIRNLYKSPIFTQYLSLSHIIFKQKYLIPQRPLPPPVRLPSNIPLNLAFAQLHPEKMQSAGFEAQLKKQNCNPLLAQLKEMQYQQSNRLLQSQLQKHYQNYIYPLVQYEQRTKPHELYYLQQQTKLEKTSQNNSSIADALAAEQQFRSLPPNLKLSYEQKCRQLISRRHRQYGPIADQYRIPRFVETNGEQLYLQSLKGRKQGAEKIVAFDKLDESQKQDYRKAAIRRKQLSINDLKSFLSRNQLTQPKYSEILQVCLSFKRLLTNLHTTLKLQPQIINSLQDHFNIWFLILKQPRVEIQNCQNASKTDASSHQKKKHHPKSHHKETQPQTDNQKLKRLHKPPPITHKKQLKNEAGKQLKNEGESQPKPQKSHDSQTSDNRVRNQTLDRKQKPNSGDAKNEGQEVFEQSQCLNYDYEEIRLLREINKRLKASGKDGSEQRMHKK